MNRLTASLSALAMLSSALSAQCFETNFGTSIGSGDDSLLAVTPMNITFPMGGIAASYTHVQPNTNGNIYLTNGAAGVGTTSTGYSTAAATMVTNLRGAAGGSPRIAAYWRDLNLTVANSGAVWVNNSIPGKCVVTWANAVHFGQTTPVFTVQAQLFSSGRVVFFYSATTQNTAICPLVGISQGNGIADPGASDLSVASSGVSTSQIVYQTFATANTFDLQTTAVTFTPNAGGGYDVLPTPCVPATHTSYGSGCYNVSATWYELFGTSSFDLSNSSIRMTPNGFGGYDMAPGSASFFTHTVAGLAQGDDVVTAVTLPAAFNYPGGSTTSIGVCSNGYIWMQGTNTLADFSPSAAELFSNPARLCPAWCDLLPDGATNVANVFAEADVVNNKFYVTWLNVPTFTTPGTVTMQVELDLTSGAVEYRYQGCTIPASATITGWTPGSPLSVIDPGTRDISTTLAGGFSTKSTENRPLTLAGSPTPVIGSPITYTTSNVPGTALFNLLIVSLGEQTPPIDLAPAGAPGCPLLVTLGAFFSFPSAGSPTTSAIVPLPADPTLAGGTLYCQSFTIDPASNAAGVITSNGVRSRLNTF